MRKLIYIFLISIIGGFLSVVTSQQIALKNNLLYDLTATPNLAVEFRMSDKTTLDILGGFNPFNLGTNKKLKHFLVQPEVRYWTCESFNGLFFGLHLHGGMYNLGGVKLPLGIFPALETKRYEGYFLGGGLSVGYHWILSSRFSIEASAGYGYVYTDRKKFNCEKCSDIINQEKRNLFLPTKAAISLIYIIK